MGKHIKKYLSFIKENSTSNGEYDNLYNLKPEQFYKLYEFLTSSIELFDDRDYDFYENVIGLNMNTLVDLYTSYGRDSRGNRDDANTILNGYLSYHNTTLKELEKAWKNLR